MSRKSGIIKFFKKESGYGFITQNDDKSEIFFHVTKVKGGIEPSQGNNVEYEIGEGKEGRGVAAVDVCVV